MGSPDLFVGRISALSRQWRAQAAEAEHAHGDDRLGAVEAERAAGDQADLGVGRLDPGIGQAMLEAGRDLLPVRIDRASQFDERCQAAAPGPAHPAAQQVHRLVDRALQRGSELLFQQVGVVQGGVR